MGPAEVWLGFLESSRGWGLGARVEKSKERRCVWREGEQAGPGPLKEDPEFWPATLIARGWQGV